MQTPQLNLSRLNPAQREAVLHGTGPLLVLAGAGSGKTSTMAYRIAHLLTAKHVRADQILGLSFTNKAARELRERVSGLVKPFRLRKLPRITTFHSLGVAVIRAHAEALGYTGQFTILDSGDQEAVVRDILRTLSIDDKKFDPRSLLFQISLLKNRGYRT